MRQNAAPSTGIIGTPPALTKSPYVGHLSEPLSQSDYFHSFPTFLVTLLMAQASILP